jgi:hypothetical protein
MNALDLQIAAETNKLVDFDETSFKQVVKAAAKAEQTYLARRNARLMRDQGTPLGNTAAPSASNPLYSHTNRDARENVPREPFRANATARRPPQVQQFAAKETRATAMPERSFTVKSETHGKHEKAHHVTKGRAA